MADLNALIAQGVQFQAPPDPFSQYAKFQQLQIGQNQLAQQQLQMRELQSAGLEKNAMRDYVSQPGFDVMRPEHQAGLMAKAPTIAPAYIEKALTTRKTTGEIKSLDFKLQQDMLKHGIASLTAADTPEQAIAAVDDGVKKGYFDAATGEAEKQQIAQAASAGQFGSYIKNKVIALMDAKEQFAARSPKPKEVKRADGSIVFMDENPNSPTFGKEVMPQQAAGMTPYEKGRLEIDKGQLKVSQGNLANAQARLKFEQENPGIEVKEQADGSFIGINKRTGTASPITMGATGQPVMGAAKPLTESQGSSVAYGMRMAEADKILKELEATGLKDTGMLRSGISGAVGAIPLIGQSMSKGVDNVFNVLPSIMAGLSPEQQKTLQARANFITAVLRKESGAVIGQDEFDREERKYFPAPGDGPEVVKQKQQARATAIKTMKVQAGSGAGEIDKHVSGGKADPLGIR